MARRSFFIPEEVKAEIRNHVSKSYQLALDGYNSAGEEEDALTGDLGASLRIKNQSVRVLDGEIGGVWRWSIDYCKFRGRGPGATENILGADGIFELNVQNSKNYIQKKSLLFQSKIDWKNDTNIFRQAVRMTTWREAAFILNYTQNEYEAIDLDSAILSKGKRDANMKTVPLDKYIGENFLNCQVGDMDLWYDAKARVLTWRNVSNELVSMKFSIPSRISVKVIAPIRKVNDFYHGKEINESELPDNRMDASAEDILSLNDGYTSKELRSARADKARIYHLDANAQEDNSINEFLNRRMQEANMAIEELRKRSKEQ